MKNILITGASGMLGASLVNDLKNQFNVYATGNSFFKEQHSQFMKFDLKSDCYLELIQWANPDIIIHSAALTNGNFCEKHPIDAFNINGISVQKLLNATNNDVKIIYISSDAVFPSSLHLAKELDCVFPENVYGKSKELGEFFLKTSNNRSYTIIRTTIFGLNLNTNKVGFAEWIINTAKDRKELGLFTDVLFTPISIWDLANEIEFLIKTDNINSESLHVAGELCTKYEFGCKLLDKLNIPTKTLSKTLISSYKDRAKRSNDQSLDSSYYSQKYQRELISLDQTILKLKEHYEYN
ncbi:SDR family oxidoreductase [uncultured Polaribacter sp.]|uniref:dTDP-4-dehydrorhamnose reductase family protein n=1 Tax=uncultured Polaribacter sp. TaxID=174711 RepID=UPI002627F645|nr:SDR family oxidoreductase [uncultured Polaribacter sp.]